MQGVTRRGSSKDLPIEQYLHLDQPETAKAAKMNQQRSSRFSWSAMAKSSIADYCTLVVLVFVLAWSETALPFEKTIYNKDDQEYWRYSYPLHQNNTVPSWTVPMIATVVPLTVIALFALVFRPSRAEIHAVIIGLLSSVFITATVTNLIKIGVGRPRPNFVNRCWPDGNLQFKPNGEPICASNAIDPAEGRKSFPSGHTSWSTSGLGYLTFWLAGHLRVFDGSGHPVRLCLAGLPLCCAGWIGITRLQDYWHHVEDVIAGFLLGATIAYLCYRQHFPALLGPKTGEAYVLVPSEPQGWEFGGSHDLEMGGRPGLSPVPDLP